MIKPGDRVRDRLSGLEGVVTSITEFLYWCRRVGVQTDLEAGATKAPDTFVVDEPQLELIAERAFVPELPEATTEAPRRTGGDQSINQRPDVPTR